MSISLLTFANSVVYTNIVSDEVSGQITYNDGGVSTDQVTSATPFSLNPNADYETKTLITYADGKKIRIHYHIYQESSYYIMKHYYDLVDANDNLVSIPGSIAHNNPTQVYTDQEPWDPTQPGMDVFPFSECYYIPAVVNYFVSGQLTIVGDPAESCYPFGSFSWKHSRPPIGGYIDRIGTKPTADFRDSYGSKGVNIVAITTDSQYTNLFNAIDPNDDWHKTQEPSIPPDPSGPGGGDRPTDDDGEPVDFPALPSTSVINTGLISLYNPDAAQLRSLAGVLWGNDFEQSIKKVLNDPFDGLIGLSMIPFSPTTSGSISCDIGNFDTQIAMPLVNAQYYTLDCGSITVSENWRNALDYNATTIEIFVPFVGFRSLNIQDCMGKTLSLKYNVDILSGSGVAILKCGDKCLYEWPCNVAYNIPLTGSNKAALYTGLIQVALSGAGGLAAGGAMGAVGGAATSAINVATHAQSDVQRSGAVVSNTGALGEFTPYIVIHRPKQSLAQNFKSFKGYQSNMTLQLGSCSGYTEVEYIHLTGINGATDTELNEIETLLKNGVII